MQIWALIVDSFRYTRDRKVFWVMLVLSVVIAGAAAGISFDDTGATVFFKWHLDDPALRAGTETQRTLVIEVLVYWFISNYIGFVGTILALVATAGIFPALMESGAVEGVAAKPLSRAKLFLGKYLGGMSFVLVQSVVLVGLTFLVAGLRWKQWLWPYWWSVPLAVLLFSYVYAFCVLFSMWMRGGMGPVTLALVCWFGCFVMQKSSTAVALIPGMPPNSQLVRVSAVLGWLVPRTSDVPHIAARLIDRDIADKMFSAISPMVQTSEGPINAERDIQQGKREMSFSIAASILSSLSIEVLILLLAAWRFTRLDF